MGGGVYGAWMAYDAALRGLRVALLERTDWAAGASSSSSKLIHGGLRYLEHLWLVLVKKTLAERRLLAALGPHRIRPLRFLLPVYEGDRVGRLRLKIGLTLYDRLAGGSQPVPPHCSLGREEILARCGFLDPKGLAGGFEYGDCVTDDARFTLEIVAGAIGAGAAAVNHVEVTDLLRAGIRIAGAIVRDREKGGLPIEVPASVTINAAGAWLGRIGRTTHDEWTSLNRLTKGVHLVMPPLPAKQALLLTARSDGRPFFLIPWYGKTLLGTTDTDFRGDPDAARVEGEDVRYLLSEANLFLAGIRWTDSDIEGSFTGLRSLRNVPGRSPSAVTREWSIEEPEERLLVSVGGKFTSARADAAEAIDRVMEILGRPPGPCPTERRPFPWSPTEPLEAWVREQAREGEARGLDREAAVEVAFRYGTSVAGLHALLSERPDLAARIHPSSPFVRAEILHAARNEMAWTLEDILRRRIPLTVLSKCDERVLADAADVAASALGWSRQRHEAEVSSLLRSSAGVTRGETP